MSYNLFLDDERFPAQVTWVDLQFYRSGRDLVIARNFVQFYEVISQRGLPERVSFDHDLADYHYQVAVEDSSYTYDDGDLKKTFNYGSEKTGFDCAKWLVDFCIDNDLKFPNYTVHSMNPIGKQRIIDYIEWAKDKAGI